MVRLVVSRRASGAKADVVRGRGERAENRHWIHASRILVTMTNSDRLVVAKPVRNGKAIGKEDQIELASLERLRDVDVVRGGEKRDGARRVPPKRMAMCYGAGDQKTSEVHAAPRSSHPVLLGETSRPLDQASLDGEQVQPSAIAVSHREADHAIGLYYDRHWSTIQRRCAQAMA